MLFGTLELQGSKRYWQRGWNRHPEGGYGHSRARAEDEWQKSLARWWMCRTSPCRNIGTCLYRQAHLRSVRRRNRWRRHPLRGLSHKRESPVIGFPARVQRPGGCEHKNNRLDHWRQLRNRQRNNNRSVIIGKETTLGDGSVIMSGVRLAPRTKIPPMEIIRNETTQRTANKWHAWTSHCRPHNHRQTWPH